MKSIQQNKRRNISSNHQNQGNSQIQKKFFNSDSQVLSRSKFFSNTGVNIQKVDNDEALAHIWNIGPIDALRARRDSETARQAAMDSGLPGLHNGPADAFRHAYWNCLMTRSIGADQAKEVADTHEAHGPNHPHEHAMDFHNNNKGRQAGAQDGDCAQLVMGMLRSGELQIIPNYEEVTNSRAEPQAPVPSNTAPIPATGATGGEAGYY